MRFYISHELCNRYQLYRCFALVISLVLVVALLSACDTHVWNNPNPVDRNQSIFYSSFTERPKHLDPARSYSSNEYSLLGQIYEPALQYHYLKRPYQLIPLTAQTMPSLSYIDEQGQPTSADNAAFISYEVEIMPGVLFQPHPAFAQTGNSYLYHQMTENMVSDIYRLADFSQTDTRELRASDYVYQIKRLADPALHSPIASILSRYIEGFATFRSQVAKAREQLVAGTWVDLRNFEMSGVEVLGPYRYRLKVSSEYPQFIYWLAMPFFSAMPWEADRFYNQTSLRKRNITLDWFPIGTGAFMLTENNPNLRMVLERNPNFRTDRYPNTAEYGDKALGLLDDAGQRLPFIDKAIYSLEKENIPYWNKFLQGYYDGSGISADSFDQAIQVNQNGELGLTDFMIERGINLSVAYDISTIYIGFNMLDPVVGGYSDRARKLRQALSIAIDIEEYISIFLNGRGLAAQGPLPPGLFAYRGGVDGINHYIYDWVGGSPQRKPIAEAKRLLAEAGYKDGINQDTGKPLLLHFDSVGTGPDAKAWLNWLRKQLAKIDIQLVIRNTDYNRFQDKMAKAKAQIFRWGWNADYPDPENFLFLFYGPNAKFGKQGENASNYQNPEFDKMFEQMRSLSNTVERQALIDKMVELLRYDAPWAWGYHPKSFALYHGWLKNVKPNHMAHNRLKYLRVNDSLRVNKQNLWNRPNWLPVLIFVLLLLVFVLPAVYIYRQRQRLTAL